MLLPKVLFCSGFYVFLKVIKGITHLSESQAWEMMTQGIICSWWRNAKTISPAGRKAQLIETNIDLQLNHYANLLPPGHPYEDLGKTYWMYLLSYVCGITKSLTFHGGRHTFAATITLNNNVPIETVSKMLGHKSINTIQIFCEILNLKVGKDMAWLIKNMETAHKF